jgi:hypothetical protein
VCFEDSIQEVGPRNSRKTTYLDRVLILIPCSTFVNHASTTAIDISGWQVMEMEEPLSDGLAYQGQVIKNCVVRIKFTIMVMSL